MDTHWNDLAKPRILFPRRLDQNGKGWSIIRFLLNKGQGPKCLIKSATYTKRGSLQVQKLLFKFLAVLS